MSMEPPFHPLEELFDQLGLPSHRAAIEAFIASHRLPPDVELPDAPFWNPAQVAFLRDALNADSDWAEVVDELNHLLRARP